MYQKVFLEVLDHLVSHFGGRGGGGSWNFFFQILDFGISRGWSGGTKVSEVGVRVFFRI